MPWNPADYDDRAIGPMGLHDAHLLDAICRYVRPKVALEYGGLLGHSLAVMSDWCGHIISVDDNAGEALRAAAEKAGNATVFKSDMKDFDPWFHGFKQIDLVLFDASHLFNDYRLTFEKIEPLLTERCAILVHDTGDWFLGELPPQWDAWKEHRATFLEEDREFVRYLRSKGWSDVTFESPDHLRHGYTMLTKPRW